MVTAEFQRESCVQLWLSPLYCRITYIYIYIAQLSFDELPHLCGLEERQRVAARNRQRERERDVKAEGQRRQDNRKPIDWRRTGPIEGGSQGLFLTTVPSIEPKLPGFYRQPTLDFLHSLGKGDPSFPISITSVSFIFFFFFSYFQFYLYTVYMLIFFLEINY